MKTAIAVMIVTAQPNISVIQTAAVLKIHLLAIRRAIVVQNAIVAKNILLLIVARVANTQSRAIHNLQIMDYQNLSSLLLHWYETYGRNLPWRVKGGAHPNPYIIIVSEIMLQQTTVKTVLPYFARFIERFPDIESLALADIEEVYRYWQGLGYYSRARSLHATAQIIVNAYGGVFPQEKSQVEKLKGFGKYTVASYLALAFNKPETVVDGNVIRIICRLFHLTKPIDEISAEINAKASAITDVKQPADYASAIMDLGALICTPKNPQCLLCPWNSYCQSKSCKDLETIPQRSKTTKKEMQGYCYIIQNKNGEIFIRKRSEKGLLSGLYEFPWSEMPLVDTAQDLKADVTHIFTHIKLTLKLLSVKAENFDNDGFFVSVSELGHYPMSSLMKKAAKKALHFG